jgi:hypothetical protein
MNGLIEVISVKYLLLGCQRILTATLLFTAIAVGLAVALVLVRGT